MESSDLLKAFGMEPPSASQLVLSLCPSTDRHVQSTHLNDHGSQTLEMLKTVCVGENDEQRIEHIAESYPADVDVDSSKHQPPRRRFSLRRMLCMAAVE